MKRTAATFVMLAGLGGCMSPDKENGPKPFGQAMGGREVPGVMGPAGEPIHVTAAAQMPSGPGDGVTRADLKTTSKTGSGIRQTAGYAHVGGGAYTPGVMHDAMKGGCADGSCGAGGPGGPGLSPYGPMAHGLGQMLGHGGIVPVPGMGPAGAVAAVGAMGGPGSGMYPGMYTNQRTSIRFANPAGMKISWQGPGGTFADSGLEAPVRYNFPQGAIYRLRLSNFPNRPGVRPLYPTLEVYPATPKTVTYLSHNTVPVSITDDDFEQVLAGNLVVKVVYLPNDVFQDLAAVAGADEVVSTRLEPGIDPIAEANRRGTILAVLRIGNIDLQDPNTPGMDVPPAMPVGPAGPGLTAPRLMTPPDAAPKNPPAPLPPAVKPSVGGTVPSPAERTISLPSLK